MASIQYTSSSSSLPTHIYDVFVSFRGENTLNNFTAFLFQALRTKGINVFKDDEDLKKGESIAPELLQAIQASLLFVVVFSQNYASFTWYLRELAEICNCVERCVIILIFYDVDPLVRLREDEVKMEEVQRWRPAFTQVADLSGWDIQNKIHHIFDNVDQGEQLKLFTRNKDIRRCIGGGSRIIIISMDEHIVKTHGVDDVYQVQPLGEKNAIQLFCRNAFKVNYILGDYEELAYEVLSHAEGHPLAIERSALGKLRYNKDRNIMNVSRISFDQLKEEEKEIFLDIACFLQVEEGSMIHFDKTVEEILSIRGFDYENGILALIEKSLITCENENIYMHALLMDLGHSIATENLEVIYIEHNFLSGTLSAEGLSKIRYLNLLSLDGVNFSGSLNHLSNELMYLSWRKYLFKSLPQSFHPEKLVELQLDESSIKRLWKGAKVVEALKLEEIKLIGCIKLKKIDPSIGLLRKLTFLNLKNCKSLGNNFTTLPNLKNLSKLYCLNLQHCKQLKWLLNLPTQTNLLSIILKRQSSYFKDENVVGLIIYNWPKLVEREQCSSMIFSWMIHSYEAICLKVRYRTYRCPTFESVIPRSEIPRWFNNQFVSMDNSIKNYASPVQHDYSCIGVMCCAIFHMGNEKEKTFNTFIHKARIPPINLRKDLVIDKSDHMWLFYLDDKEFRRSAYGCRWNEHYKYVITKLITDWSSFTNRKSICEGVCEEIWISLDI
ncbi:hypothetical protein PHAVU_010G054500 [Phaseolus vulgaris]|uniref:TIR domain-containing protein n=1 Tax=Phaseolus vulgaris TaxID=3885 RepID=V7AQM4_PHAVU|nr:hypothetical protein PHAVU_010G054500g [Phaseolus vulgaris]ESW06516.1 hypothetical protein PHAVU_010G054500g [Phaseolus vulgaris]